ncbi:MAG: Gar1/Naf1 family protein [Methanocorpusculum sp.]|nr:Gar1/Naf1 family protein [Methanocorpusculum sp.]
MKIAGRVTALRGKRLLIAKCDAGQLPPLYTDVANENEQPVGKIVDLYGSVARPYVTILCCGESSAGVSIGDTLYVIIESKPEKPKQKFRRTNRNGSQPAFAGKRSVNHGNRN